MFLWDFVINTTIKPKCFIPEQVFIPAVSHMNFANINLGTIHQSMRIALQFSYQFAIFISVCNSHVSVYSSYVDICNFHMSLHFSYEFAIFISFAILMSQLQHLLTWLCMDSMSLWLELPQKDKILIWKNILYQVMYRSTQYNILHHTIQYIFKQHFNFSFETFCIVITKQFIL